MNNELIEVMTLDQRTYIVRSLELHLFFGRIMKEHAIFLEAGFTPKNGDYAKEADRFKTRFETLLSGAVNASGGILRPEFIASGEMVTDFTLGSEQKTQNFTGIPINQNITRAQGRLYSGGARVTPEQLGQVRQMNREAGALLSGIIAFKQDVLNAVVSCNMFTMNYPLLIEHILREARQYLNNLQMLERGEDTDLRDAKQTEMFWNQIMLEHALFIRGLLDPSEKALVQTANNFAREYDVLLRNTADASLAAITDASLAETVKYRDFKIAGTKGIAECKIRSVILPLLADHVLREANHYIRLLKMAASLENM